MDVLWLRLPKYTEEVAGIEAFRQSVARLAPELTTEVEEIKDWKDIALLAAVQRRREWPK